MHLLAVTHPGVCSEKRVLSGISHPWAKFGLWQARKRLVFLVVCHVSKTWEYKEHLNGGAACCRLCGQLYSGESLGYLMINLLVRARRQPCGEIGTSFNSSDWNTTC